MTAPNPALLPSPALFDVTTVAQQEPRRAHRPRRARPDRAGTQRPPRDLPRRDRPAGRNSRANRLNHPLASAIGRRGPPVILYARQRRLLAAHRSHELHGTKEFEALEPVRSLIVLLLPPPPPPP